MLRLHVNPFDYTILGIYFALVVTIGVMARRAVATRGPAGPVGQGPERGPADAADRGVPEDLQCRADDHPRPDRAGHININLWMGLGMLAIGAFFTTGWRLRPLRPDKPQPDQPQPDIGTGHEGKG